MLTAINKHTGDVLFTSSSQTKQSFIKTVVETFSITENDFNIIDDNKSCKNGIIWKGPFYDLGGYSNLNREICFRLKKYDIDVKPDILITPPQIDINTKKQLQYLSSNTIPNNNPMIIGYTPMSVNKGRRKLIDFTMIETQDIHPLFIKRCNQANEVWVPCKFYYDLFKRNGVRVPIQIMPLGIDDKKYIPKKEFNIEIEYDDVTNNTKVSSKQISDKFKFISIFGWSYRKGPDILCKSFLDEFDYKDNTCLILYSRYKCSDSHECKEYVKQEIKKWINERKCKNTPQILYCGNIIPIDDMPKIYNYADCFVWCSRGEGFGLEPIEAGACQIPVISTLNTGMTQYLDNSVATIIEDEGTEIANSNLTWISDFYKDRIFVKLGEQSIISLRKSMRNIYTNKTSFFEKSINFKKRILSEYTWDIAAEKVANRIKEIV